MGQGSIADFTRRVLVLLAVIALAALVLKLGYLLLLLFGSVVVAVVIRLLAQPFERLGLGRGIATTIAVLLLIGFLVGFGVVFGGLISGQFSMLQDQFPGAVERVQAQLEAWNIDYDLEAAAQSLLGQASTIFQRAGGFMLSAGSIIADIVLVLAGAVFLAANPEFYRKGLMRLLPQSSEGLATRTLSDCGKGLKLWLAGQAVASLFVGVFVYIGLTIAGVPNAFALAIIAAAFELIPYVGPILAAIPGVVLGLSVDPSTGLWTAVVYLIIQQLEGNVLNPLIQKRAVELPPLVLLFSIFAAGVIFGAPGIVLAAPLTVVIYVLVQHLYIGHVLGRTPKRPGRDAENAAI